MNTDLLSMTPEELKDFLASLGEPAFRAAQIFEWMHRGADLDGMTNLPKSLREKLKGCARIPMPKIAEKLVSKLDGTVKYLFELEDGELIESVVMKYHHGNTICISSQVGCRMGCRFCASTLKGLKRCLAPSEMLGQIIAAQKDTGERISGVVMMGIGEPLDNYDNVIRFLRLVGHEKGLNIGYRHISLSTCGLADKIGMLAEEEFPITLSISLHAPDDEARSAIMPVNNRFHVAELLTACRDYFRKTGRRITFEYTLIAGKNDSDAQARALASVLFRYLGRDIPFHVNLIPLNEVKERALERSSRDAVAHFQQTLGSLGVNATVRRRLGPDINASCGQLRHRSMEEKEKNGEPAE